jgi:hypothetical protein
LCCIDRDYWNHVPYCGSCVVGKTAIQKKQMDII